MVVKRLILPVISSNLLLYCAAAREGPRWGGVKHDEDGLMVRVGILEPLGHLIIHKLDL